MIINKLKTANYIYKTKFYKNPKYTFTSSSNSQKNVYSDLSGFSKENTGQENNSSQNNSNTDLQQIPVLNDEDKSNEIWYDIAIIGGGSGGLSLAFEAKSNGLKPIIFDYVEKSNQNYTWGLGGTCVNVGCIPKKLMHIASQVKEMLVSSSGYGWDLGQEEDQLKKFSWKTLVYNIRKYLLDNNIYYEMKLKAENIPYINAFATLHDKNTVVFSDDKKNIINYLENISKLPISENQEEIQQQQQLIRKTNLKSIKSRYIVLCTGGRPNTVLKSCPDIHKYSLTSDDFFFNQTNPGKTLVVGGGYVALECAGILSTLGNDVTIMTKDKYLRSFDQQIANQIVNNLKLYNKVNVIPTSLPISVDKNEKSKKQKLTVQYQNQKTQEIGKDRFDSILLAIGRYNNTQHLNLDRVGVQYDPQTMEIKGNYNGETEQTSVSNIFALGDILEGAPKLTPVAQKAGKFLAKRIFYKNMSEVYKIDTREKQKQFTLNYEFCPTTVFTPTEYSCVGLSQEEAIKKYGKQNITVYHSRYIPLDQVLSEEVDTQTFQPLKRKSYIKLICDKEEENILGIHYVGQSAGEIMQGLSIALHYSDHISKLDNIDNSNQNEQKEDQNKSQGILCSLFCNQQPTSQQLPLKQNNSQNKKLTKKIFDQCIGIHPTLAEEFVNLTKKESEDPDKDSC